MSDGNMGIQTLIRKLFNNYFGTMRKKYRRIAVSGLLLFLTILPSYASWAQELRISLQMKDVAFVKVLEEIRKLTDKGIVPDLVHIAHTPDYEKVFEALLPFAGPHTCFVIGKPYLTGEKKRWWKSVIDDSRTGVTFDLYDVGVVFFDKNRVKEHRVVNFL